MGMHCLLGIVEYAVFSAGVRGQDVGGVSLGSSRKGFSASVNADEF